MVVGGGPAGSFFAIQACRKAERLGRSVRVVIFEKKTEVCFYSPSAFCSWEGCNYCAGGISPRLADILRENEIFLPTEVIESTASEVIVHGDWKSIQLPVPEDREVLSVFRGSRPRQRAGRYENFDSFLLHAAAEEGAEVITAQVTDVAYAESGRPVVGYRTVVDEEGMSAPQSLEADFAVISSGVNSSMGRAVESDPLFTQLQDMIHGLRAPAVRKAVIAELQGDSELLRVLDGQVHFVQYGSKDLHIEMASLIPKENWVTVVLLGRSVDQAGPADYLNVVNSFVELPHIRRLLPRDARLRARCSCHPSMTVGAARHPFGDRIALAGDIAVSRLYKDGLYSAWVTVSALADCIFEEGIDSGTLGRCYAPVVGRAHADNRYGRLIFLSSRWVFGRPALSRILYQAIIIERMTIPREQRRLEEVLWRIASGDDSYRRILAAMLHPASLWLIFTGGFLATLRNVATERLFDLDWAGIGRYSTGVPFEENRRKRRELFAIQGLEPPGRAPDMERMFTIRIAAPAEAIFRQLGAFGDDDRQYFKPRFIRVTRRTGSPNQVGTSISYTITPIPALSFTVALEKAIPGRYLLYRILDGFGRGGIFSFDVRPLKPGVNLLSIYVGFNFPRQGRASRRMGGWLGRHLFPQYAHDVLWNHSLCRIKQLAEAAGS